MYKIAVSDFSLELAYQAVIAILYLIETFMWRHKRQLNGIFSRVHDEEKIAEACSTVIGRLALFDVDQMTENRLSHIEPHYDVFLSYSHFNEDIAKKVIKELRIYQPDIKIFIDTDDLKAGGAWQQALYEAIGKRNVL